MLPTWAHLVSHLRACHSWYYAWCLACVRATPGIMPACLPHLVSCLVMCLQTVFDARITSSSRVGGIRALAVAHVSGLAASRGVRIGLRLNRSLCPPQLRTQQMMRQPPQVRSC